MFLVCDVVSKEHVIKDQLTLCEALLEISQYPVMFGGNRYSGSRDMMLLVCKVISQGDVIKGLCDFIWWTPSW